MKRCVLIFIVGWMLYAAVSSAAQTTGSYDAAREALAEAYNEDAPVRNIIHLYLRLAGLVWIVAEWVAAFVLVRMYFFLPRYLNLAEEGK